MYVYGSALESVIIVAYAYISHFFNVYFVVYMFMYVYSYMHTY